jgi:hypothetical protein
MKWTAHKSANSPLALLKDVKGVSIMIEGSPFLANPTSLPSDGLHVILGMDWLSGHRWVISCSPKYVEITCPCGRVVCSDPNHERTVSMLCAFSLVLRHFSFPKHPMHIYTTILVVVSSPLVSVIYVDYHSSYICARLRDNWCYYWIYDRKYI